MSAADMPRRRARARPREPDVREPQALGSVTMADVARAAGVAPMTVSNAYKHPSKVAPETRERVLAAARSLGYVRNLIAGDLASGRSRVIGAAVPSLQNSNFAGMIQGLEDQVTARGYHLMLAVASTSKRELRAVEAFLERRVDGVVLTGNEHDPATSRILKRARSPVIETWSLEGPFIDMGVGFSLYDAAREMTEFLLERGRRRIGFAGFLPVETPRFRERQRGFEDALSRAGVRSDLTHFSPDTSGFAAGRLALDALLEREPGLDALFCATDVIAAGALFECARRGWAVPERLAVAGYGDYEIAAEISPRLTTVGTPSYEIGRTAARMIIDEIEMGRVAERVSDVGYRLVIRDSA